MTRRLAAWWLRSIRRHYCYRCERTTFHVHVRCSRLTDELIANEMRTWTA